MIHVKIMCKCGDFITWNFEDPQVIYEEGYVEERVLDDLQDCGWHLVDKEVLCDNCYQGHFEDASVDGLQQDFPQLRAQISAGKTLDRLMR